MLTGLLDDRGSGVGFDLGACVSRSYRPDTFVLESRFERGESVVEVTDTMWEGRIVRRVVARRGPAPITVRVDPGRARDVSAWSSGMAFDGVFVRCDAPFVAGRTYSASRILDTGETLVVTVSLGDADPMSVDDARSAEDRATRMWANIAGRVAVRGPWEGLARRSALVVCALGRPVPVLSPVTSLPRVVGGERNGDGRVVSPVVAASWIRAARAIGLAEEADDAASWLASALDSEPPLPLVLGLDGEPPRSAVTTGLAGWQRSQPVVFGSDLGERRSVEPIAAALAAVPSLARHVEHVDWLATHWRDDDASVWGRPPSALFTPAPWLAARVGLDAAAADARRRNPLDLDAAAWHVAARDIERALLDLPGPALPSGDASITRIAHLGPWPASDPLVAATLAAVSRSLSDGGWVLPYGPDVDDGLEGHEPPSLVATLWLAAALARTGRWDEAHTLVEMTAGLGGPQHLLPESVDVTGRQPLGNRPSAAAHVAFIEAALALGSAPA